ncbi:hypothetical protein CDV55_102082 [Aspergillus turcosus]|nr:hypothetical protein CDV55_102082 [Aspergillus turcosus]
MNYFASEKHGYLDYFRSFCKTCPRRIPAVQRIVQLGEDMLYTSEVFDQLQLRHPKEAPWVSLYSAIFDEMARGPPLLQDYNAEQHTVWSLDGDSLIKSFQTRARDMSPGKSVFDAGHLVRCVRRFNAWKSEFIGGPAAPDSAQDSDEETGDAPLPCLISGKPCIKVSREELCGLALVLGIRFRWDQRSSVFKGEGAFGLDMSVSYAQSDGHWRLSLNQIPRRPRHKPSKGSGYIPLFAIYMACGLIPFTREIENTGGWIKAVYVSQDVLKAIRSGSGIIDTDSALADAIEYLRRLPTSTFAQAWPHSGVAGIAQGIHAGEIKNKKKTTLVGTWWGTVSGIAFGGLVPQTTREVKEAVAFTMTGLYKLADKQWGLEKNAAGNISCTEALERLENIVHSEAKGLNLFGEYVNDRGNWPDANYAIKCQNTNDAAAVFGRYMTLLERLVALYRGAAQTPHQRRDCVFDETQKLLENSYKEAKNHTRGNHASETLPSETSSETIASEALANESHCNSGDLGRKLGDVIGKIAENFTASANGGNITEKDCAWVAACIITAWATNVQTISLGPGKRGNAGTINLTKERRDHGRDNAHDCNLSGDFALAEEVNLEDLPNVMAFG